MKNSINVYFCLRRDADAKPGGDTGKVPIYAFELEKFNIKSYIINDPSDLNNCNPKPDIIHIFNLQTPYENILYYKYAVKNKIPFVFSTIHHQEKYMHMYFRETFVGKIFGYELFSYLKFFAKEVLYFKSISGILKFIDLPSRINHKLLIEASILFPLSLTELKNIEHDLNIKLEPSRVSVIPNGLTYINSICKNELRTIDVIVVGRIEPRKNQLKIATALKDCGYKVLFVGDKNSNHSSYFNEFIKLIHSSTNLSYAGKKNKIQLKELYEKSRLSLSNSWFEVVSQVDLEAVTLGCKPVVSSASALFDYFDSELIALEPNCTENDILNSVNLALSDDYKPNINSIYYNKWSDIAIKIAESYFRLINNHNSSRC